MLSEVKKRQQIGVKFSDNRMSGPLFADDFVGLAETEPALQDLVDVVYNYSKCWRFEPNIKKSAVVIFSKLGNFGLSGFRFKRAFLSESTVVLSM